MRSLILKGERYILFLKNPTSFWYSLLFSYFEINRAQKIVYLQRKGLVKNMCWTKNWGEFHKNLWNYRINYQYAIIYGHFPNNTVSITITITALSLSLSHSSVCNLNHFYLAVPGTEVNGDHIGVRDRRFQGGRC